MSISTTTQRSKKSVVLGSYSELLLYPQEGYHRAMRTCYENLEAPYRGVFSSFLGFAERLETEELQAIYTELFDLNFHISLYAGYHLFGESYLRSMFLVGLSSRYKTYGFEPQGELHDHIGVLLKFIAEHPDSELASELIEDAVIPMLQRIVWSKTRPEDKPGNVTSSLAYYDLLRSLLYYLQKSTDVPEAGILNLPVNDSPAENNIDRWIKGDKKLKEEA